MSILYGALGFIAALVLFGGGVFAGVQLTKLTGVRAKQRELNEQEAEKLRQERNKLRAEQEAFHTVQNYSVERAYGMLDIPRPETE